MRAEKILLETEHSLYELRKGKEQNNKEYADQVNKQYANIGEKIIRDFILNKTEENPQLGAIHHKSLKKHLALIRNLNGGNGKATTKDIKIIKDAPVHNTTDSTNSDDEFNIQNLKDKIDYDRFQ